MKSIPRRSFHKQAGQGAAFGYLGQSLAASGRVALISDPADSLISTPPVKWAIGELRQAVEAKGATCAVVASAAEAGDFNLGIVIVGEPRGLPSEGFRFTPD